MRTRLQRERQHRTQEIKRLLAAIAVKGRPSGSLGERLSQLEESVGVMDRRLGETESGLRTIEQSTIDPDHVSATLIEFIEFWDVLYPQEKTRIVHLLVERVVCDSRHGGIRLVFRNQQPQDLAPDPDRASSVHD